MNIEEEGVLNCECGVKAQKSVGNLFSSSNFVLGTNLKKARIMRKEG